MKRILVIDDSEVVQETLDLVLGGEFSVLKRPFAKGGDPLAEVDERVELIILGIGPAPGFLPGLVRRAERSSFAVLFLVDSQSAARVVKGTRAERIGCLSKPFNPYDLLDEVRRLIGSETVSEGSRFAARVNENQLANDQYIEYPYINRAAASLIHRFAASRLPVLIFGEVGCGRENVARAICRLDGPASSSLILQAGGITADCVAEKRRELLDLVASESTAVTLLINDVDKLAQPEQSLLLDFLDADFPDSGRGRLLATTGTDLLERVYRGQFLEGLYYKFSTLTLKLLPLRDRRQDIGPLAEGCARSIGKKLGLDTVALTAGALERLSNYLWFGNVRELEAVIARTLVTHGRGKIDAADLIFDFRGDGEVGGGWVGEQLTSAQPVARTETTSAIMPQGKPGMAPDVLASDNGGPKDSELNVLIHELAHELKNPMVTIKTFAQLLADRYHDESFRLRFQNVVGDDIERMDGVLEMMIEFSDFSSPRTVAFALDEKVRSAIRDMSGEFAQRQATIRWHGKAHSREIRADEEQIRYVLRNTLVTVLSQIKAESELEVDIEKQGSVAFSYVLAGGRVRPITYYLGGSVSEREKTIWPLRILLAKHLVEQNGGRMALDHASDEREILTMEFPVI